MWALERAWAFEKAFAAPRWRVARVGRLLVLASLSRPRARRRALAEKSSSVADLVPVAWATEPPPPPEAAWGSEPGRLARVRLPGQAGTGTKGAWCGSEVERGGVGEQEYSGGSQASST